MTTTGYGDYSATNVPEMIYASAVMVFGKLLFGFILGSIASTLANLETQRVMFEEKLSAIKVDYSACLQSRSLYLLLLLFLLLLPPPPLGLHERAALLLWSAEQGVTFL